MKPINGSGVEKRINVLLAVTAVLTVIFGGLAYFFRGAEHDSAQTGDVMLPMCEYIDIEILRLDVELVPYDGKNIRVVYKNELPLELRLGDNRLIIRESEEFVISLFAGSEAEFGLTVYLPEETYREITVYTGGGNVSVYGADCEKMTVITGSGDIRVENNTSLVNLVTSSGNISLDFAEVVQDSSVQTRSGSAEILLPKDSSVAVEFETDTGECVTELFKGNVYGSYTYSFNGGKRGIFASLESGTLTIAERGGQED